MLFSRSWEQLGFYMAEGTQVDGETRVNAMPVSLATPNDNAP